MEIKTVNLKNGTEEMAVTVTGVDSRSRPTMTRQTGKDMQGLEYGGMGVWKKDSIFRVVEIIRGF